MKTETKETKRSVLKTTLHTYSFDLSNPQDRETYHQLKTKLEKTPGRGHKMHSLKMRGDFDPQPGEIELETEYLFGNQWNANVGRVFDWYEEAIFNNGKENLLIKRGHYLDITEEMRELRDNTLKCGYTGAQFPKSSGAVFNTTAKALGSPHLKESELHLVRLLPVSDEWRANRQPLTDAERDFLLPLYIEAQTKTNTKARDAQRKEVLRDYNEAITTATTERDGFLWLLDNGIQTENCIYYSHTGRFCFGWRGKHNGGGYTGEARLKLLELLKRFPFPYDVE